MPASTVRVNENFQNSISVSDPKKVFTQSSDHSLKNQPKASPDPDSSLRCYLISKDNWDIVSSETHFLTRSQAKLAGSINILFSCYLLYLTPRISHDLILNIQISFCIQKSLALNSFLFTFSRFYVLLIFKL